MRRYVSVDALLIGGFAAANILLHLLLPEYGYHRDEMYYVAIADGFSFGNLDMPPVSPLFLKLFLGIFGHSIKVVHLAASTAGAAVIALTLLTVRELGGKRFAMILTGTLLIFSGLLIFGSIYTYDAVSFVLWAGVFYLIARMLNGATQRWWIAAGLLIGLGLLTKLTMLYLGLAIFLGLWLVPQRSWYRQPWIWVGGILALLFSIPVLLWQSAHQWYFFSYAATYAARTTREYPVLEFLWSQVMTNGPFAAPVWLFGLGVLLFSAALARYRFFGWCYLILAVAMVLTGGQFYFMIPMTAVLFAAGAVKIEQWIAAREQSGRARLGLKPVLPAAVCLLSVPFMPMFVPLLPVQLLVPYVEYFGITAGVKTEDIRLANLPQHIADRFGWEEMAAAVANVYHQVPGAGAPGVGIGAGNWGEAGALHVYGGRYRLPEPLCTDGWFYFEGLKRREFPHTLVTIGSSESELKSLFRRVERKAVFTHPYCIPHENNNVIFLCSEPKADLAAYWRIVYTMHPSFAAVLEREGVDQAVAFYRHEKQRDSTLLLFTERQMNAKGYQYLRQGRIPEAITLFSLNVEAFPESFNVYDSLGEALMAGGRYELAAANYRRSLELNPQNENGKGKLDELKTLTGPQERVR